jgi:hypothetical protein
VPLPRTTAYGNESPTTRFHCLGDQLTGHPRTLFALQSTLCASRVTLNPALTMQAIKEPTLRELREADSVASVLVRGSVGGYALVIRFGGNERLLATTRGETRLFSLESAGRFLRDLGISKFEVDTSTYEPGRLRKARPDRAAALRKTRSTPVQSSLI